MCQLSYFRGVMLAAAGLASAIIAGAMIEGKEVVNLPGAWVVDDLPAD